MSHPLGAQLLDRIQTELAEADVEIGFNLVDLAEEESRVGDVSAASQTLAAAEGVLKDLSQRLFQLGTSKSTPFQPLVAELRKTIELAKLRN